jgi:hypothetical protein
VSPLSYRLTRGCGRKPLTPNNWDADKSVYNIDLSV